jgi:hypothetical protein
MAKERGICGVGKGAGRGGAAITQTMPSLSQLFYYLLNCFIFTGRGLLSKHIHARHNTPVEFP